MSNPSIKLNRTIGEPSLQDLLNLLKKDIMLNLVTHHIAKIQSFNPTTQTATATINYKKTVFTIDPVTGLNVPQYFDYPVLLDCPVIILRGGTARLTFPISPGDDCLVLFNDRDMDNWFQSGQIAPVATSRLHSFSDGILLVGLSAATTPITPYDTLRADLANDTTGVAVSPTQIKAYNASTTLGIQLNSLLTTLNTFLTATAAATTAAQIASAASTALPNIATITSELAGLLE